MDQLTEKEVQELRQILRERATSVHRHETHSVVGLVVSGKWVSHEGLRGSIQLDEDGAEGFVSSLEARGFRIVRDHRQ